MGIGVLLAVALVLGLTGPVAAAMRGKEERVERLSKVAVKTIPLTLMLYVATVLVNANNAQSFEATRPHPAAALAALGVSGVIGWWAYTAKPHWQKSFAGAGLMAAVGCVMEVFAAWGYSAQGHHQWMMGVGAICVTLGILGVIFWVADDKPSEN